MKTRIISAAVAIVLAVLILTFNKTFVFVAAVSLISSLINFELIRAMKAHRKRLFMFLNIGFTLLYPVFFTYLNKYVSLFSVIYALLAFLCFVANHRHIKYRLFFAEAAFTVLLSLSFTAMLRLNAEYSRIYLILALCSAWIADTGAYFTGTFFGKHRLCPEVSPKKSVEGFVGGIVLNLVVEELVYILLLNQSHSVKDAVLFGITALLAGAIGTLGDLTA